MNVDIEKAIKLNDTTTVVNYMKDEDFVTIIMKEEVINKCIKNDNFHLFTLCMNIFDKEAVKHLLQNDNQFYLYIIIPILSRDYIEYIEWLYTTYQSEHLLLHILKRSDHYLCTNCIHYACENIDEETLHNCFSDIICPIINKGYLPIIKIVFQYVNIDEWNSFIFLKYTLNSKIIHLDILTFFIEKNCLTLSTDTDCLHYFSILIKIFPVSLSKPTSFNPFPCHLI